MPFMDWLLFLGNLIVFSHSKMGSIKEKEQGNEAEEEEEEEEGEQEKEKRKSYMKGCH